MIVPSACRASSVMELSPENLRRPNCPRCGNILLVAEQSRFNMRGRIDHVWYCDDCGYEFIMSIRLASERDLAIG
jgi:RNase P subunit RPR2